ncbi:hypothetical protein MESS2_1140002 [Mesorhizobium metallidurans STM 2683]|uniref:Uncharacterized protein n=1 Tax=Mesorhizobium metallidurans STM 2683 TaxID=1297569 RepID=M5EHJ2_9HYPH|nr:hypothetical protein MESS2_1140002 [Mesorhizobium metallidurans STM 2683]
MLDIPGPKSRTRDRVWLCRSFNTLDVTDRRVGKRLSISGRQCVAKWKHLASFCLAGRRGLSTPLPPLPSLPGDYGAASIGRTKDAVAHDLAHDPQRKSILIVADADLWFGVMRCYRAAAHEKTYPRHSRIDAGGSHVRRASGDFGAAG